MSRCYPFPPPGYEEKNRINDVEVLAKEKHKEKKHKKDKDREKKDEKVKKDKDRSKEKGKEKKDRREKHKHKKDRKEKSKDKEKDHGSSNDKKKPQVHLNSVDGARCNSSTPQIENHNSGNPNHAEELARRIRVEGQATGSQIVHKNTATDEGKINGTINSDNLLVLAKRIEEKEKNAVGGPNLNKIRLVDQAKFQMNTRTNDRNGCFLPEPNQKGNSRRVDDKMANGTLDSSHLQGLAKRMAEKEKNGLGGQIVQKIRLTDQAKVKMHSRMDDGNGCFVPEPNGKEKGTQVDGTAVNGTCHSQILAERKLAEGKNGLGSQFVQKIRPMDQAKVQMHTRTDDGNGCFVPETNGKEKGTQVDGRVVNGIMDCSHLQVSAKRNLAEGKNGFGGQIVQKIRLVDQAKVQMHMRTYDGNGCFVPEPNGKEKGTQVEYRTVNGGRNFEEATNAKNVVAYKGIAKPSEAKDVRIDSEGTEKSKYTRESNHKMDERKSKDWDKKSQLKDKVGDREKRKEEGAKEKCELSNGQSKAIKGGSEQNNTCSVNPEQNWQSKAITGKSVAGEGDLGKRKELEINGFLHENGSRPHKLQRPVASSPANPQNGRKSEACRTEKPKTDSGVAGLKSGLIEAPLRKVSSKSPLSTTMEASMRPPHPDSVLLGQILSLPEMDRTPNYDDQEWLFCNTGRRDSLKICESDSSERQMVWNHGSRIESADIFALPYVVPY